MIVFISDLHVGATVPLTKPAQQMRAQAKLRGGELKPLRLQLAAGAIRGFYADLTRLAQGANATEVTVVLLGDIFDFIQTRAWQDVKAGGPEPWVHGDPTEAQVLEVFRQIVEDEPVNREFFEALRGTDELCWKADGGGEGKATVKRVYVPGNHDRLCNLHGSVRARVREVLGITPPANGTPEDEFAWEFEEPEHHRVFARHGHVFDANNYAGGAAFSKAEHERTPIGDLLTTQIASRLYDRMALFLVGRPNAAAHRAYAQVVRALEAMFAASGVLGPVGFLWKRLCRQWHGLTVLQGALWCLLPLCWAFARRCCGRAWFGRSWCSNLAWALRTSVGLLALLPAVAAFMAAVIGLLWLHVQRALPWAMAVSPLAPTVVELTAAVLIVALTLQALPRKPIPVVCTVAVALAGAVLWRWWLGEQHGAAIMMPVWASVLLGVTVGSLLLWLPLLGSLSTDQALKRGAQREAADRGPGLRCIVYGHTHNPREELLSVGAKGEPVYYLNSGTWHQKLDAAADGTDFVSHKNMTYVVVYDSDEATTRQHVAQQYFETWTGTLHDGDCFRPDDRDELTELTELLAARAAEELTRLRPPGGHDERDHADG